MSIKRELPIVCILAGGQSERMGCTDKAIIMLAGVRLIDRVIARINEQSRQIIVSARDDKDTGLTVVPDHAYGLKGPVAGLVSVCDWLAINAPDIDGFLTVPVDAPFVPSDLAACLVQRDGCCVAAHDASVHPTFAWWSLRILRSVLGQFAPGDGPSLRFVAEQCGAKHVQIAPDGLMNINTPGQLKEAEYMLARE